MTAGERRVVVVGSVNRDILVRTSRHPAPGETVTGHDLSTGLGGKGLNQAVAAARAGASVVMIGAVGDDDAGLAARHGLAADGIDVDRILVRPGVRTGHAVVTVDDEGENSIVVLPGANGALAAIDLAGLLADLHSDDVVVLQNELSPQATSAAAKAARIAGATVVWNAAPAPTAIEHIPEAIDVLVVNEHELVEVARLLNCAGDDKDDLMTAVGHRLRAVVVCTLGGDGSVVVDGSRRNGVPAAQVDVVDTTAAGDTFIGYLVANLPVGGISAEHLRIAGAAAGLTVSRPGASDSIPHRRDVDRFTGPDLVGTTNTSVRSAS